MKHPQRVEDYLGHIAEAIERATSYVQQLPDRAAFEQNPQVQDAVVRNIDGRQKNGACPNARGNRTEH